MNVSVTKSTNKKLQFYYALFMCILIFVQLGQIIVPTEQSRPLCVSSVWHKNSAVLLCKSTRCQEQKMALVQQQSCHLI